MELTENEPDLVQNLGSLQIQLVVDVAVEAGVAEWIVAAVAVVGFAAAVVDFAVIAGAVGFAAAVVDSAGAAGVVDSAEAAGVVGSAAAAIVAVV